MNISKSLETGKSIKNTQPMILNPENVFSLEMTGSKSEKKKAIKTLILDNKTKENLKKLLP